MCILARRSSVVLIAAAIIIGSCCLHVGGTLRISFNSGGNKQNRGSERHKTPPQYLNLYAYPGERCNRDCVEGDRRVCYFEFTLEYYQAMGIACGKCDAGVKEDCNNPQCVVGDGFNKGVMSINRQVPGPPIHVCLNDVVIVDVHNHAHGTAAAIHWHGLHMIDTPFMDGVPFLTQCPIAYGNSFRYKFYATEVGTLLYHSHAGHHKANGQYGPLIVRQPRSRDPFGAYYHYDLPEHHIFISDWMHVNAEHFYPGLDVSDGIYADSIVINGRGVYTNPQTKERTSVPPTVFYVIPGGFYRFRVINSMNHACPIQLQIEQHNFTIIASDSFDLQPQVFDTLISNAGERFDFILQANHTSGDFWLRARGFGTCGSRPTESYALIRYKTSATNYTEDDSNIPDFPAYDETYPIDHILNHPNATCNGAIKDICLTRMSALEIESHDELLTNDPDYKFFLGFDNTVVPNKEIFQSDQYYNFANIVSNVTAVGTINGYSMAFPDYPLLTQPESIDESRFCHTSKWSEECANKTICHCIHRLKVELNSIVELVIVDETATVNTINHPFHLHGYRFLVTGMGQNPSDIPMNVANAQIMEKQKLLKRCTANPHPPFKDTISIPSRGYAIVRFKAANPGFWLMHCHYEWHLATGMALVLQVGETSEMVQAPADFPKCKNYLPPVDVANLQ